MVRTATTTKTVKTKKTVKAAPQKAPKTAKTGAPTKRGKAQQPTEILDIIVSLASWKKVKGLDERLQLAAAATLAVLPESFRLASKKAHANVLLASDAAILRLNTDFRGKKKPTNVLSFPQFSPRQMIREAEKLKRQEDFSVGDIIIAYQFTAKEARAQGKNFLDHVTHLVIHGLLHLFGYDHMSDAQARKMERLERKIMSFLDLPDPYENE